MSDEEYRTVRVPKNARVFVYGDSWENIIKEAQLALEAEDELPEA